MAAAPTAPGALVLARSHNHVFLTSQKQLHNALASMPLACGGLDYDSTAALQAMAVSTGLPFTIVLLAACYAIIQGLRAEPKT